MLCARECDEEPVFVNMDNRIPAGFEHLQCAEEVNLAALPPFLRVLLTTDGTVTKSLEAYFWEPVEVKTLRQNYQAMAAAPSGVDGGQTTSALMRQVELRGRLSQRRYARADSTIQTHLLPEKIKKGLEEGDIGVGELLLESGLETHRQVIAIGRDALAGEPCVWREYRISTGGRHFISLREWFFLANF